MSDLLPLPVLYCNRRVCGGEGRDHEDMGIFTNIAFLCLLAVPVFSSTVSEGGNIRCPCEKLRAAELRGYQIEAKACLLWCKERAENTQTGNRVRGGSKAEIVSRDEIQRIFCIDEKSGIKYTPGFQWQQGCDTFKCLTNGFLTRRKVECPRLCVPRSDKRRKCCPVCRKTVHCESREMRIEIPKEMISSKHINKVYLTDPKCRPSFSDTHVIFRTGLSTCGTKFEKTDLGLRYSNTVVRSLLGNIIVRPLFRFSCYYSVKQLEVDSPNAGKFQVRRPDENVNLRMVYTDKDGNIINGNPMQTETVEGKPVFVRIAADQTLKSDRFLIVEKCEIVSLNRRTSYPLIKEGCAVEPTLNVLERTAQKYWFTFQAKLLATTGVQHANWFSYQGKRFYPNDKEYVDLTCQAAICTSRSRASICSRRCP